jgi:hypothetical protein
MSPRIDPREAARRAAESHGDVLVQNLRAFEAAEAAIYNGTAEIPAHYYGGRQTLADRRRALRLDQPEAPAAAEPEPPHEPQDLAKLVDGLDDETLSKLGKLIIDRQFGSYELEPEDLDGE